MQQFTVPQFIDVEDKIIGPITVRQFIIMLTGFVFIGIGYKLFDFSLFLVVGILIFGVSGIFAFLKINGMPFHFFILNFVQTFKKPGLRVWNNRIDYVAEIEEKEVKIIPENAYERPRLVTTSRLAE
ncbi:MAG: PrgI family protein, partial [Candidatus Magasanikbacteria bacterium]|nr:PrgI family protein [Candidatus Magasanikbacteria bacterium]